MKAGPKLFRTTHWLLTASLSLLVACGDDVPGGGDTGFDGDGNVLPGADAGPRADSGRDNDGNVLPGNDGGPGTDTGFDNDGNVLPGNDGGLDGGPTDGNPLEVPLSEFCSGSGAVVIVGGGDLCAGDVAEETFRFGLCTCQSAEVGSQLTMDAFDSSLGPYGSTSTGGVQNILNDGNLGINATLNTSGKVDILGSAYVGGGGFAVGASSSISRNVFANGNANQANSSSSVGRNMYVNGNVSGRFDISGNLYVPEGATVSNQTNVTGQTVRGPVTVPTPCPCEPNQILDVAGLTAWARDHNDNEVEDVITSTSWENGGPTNITLPCGRYYITSINQGNSGLRIRAEGRTVLYVDGDVTVGQFNLELAPGAEIDLFIAGNLSVGASLSFGSAAQPTSVRTYSSGTATIAISGSSLWGGNFYAPRAHVSFGGSPTLYGALFARSVFFQSAATIHFDSAVRRAGQTCEPPPPDGGVVDGGPELDGGPDLDGGAPDGADQDGGVGPDANIDAGTPDTGVDAGPPDTGVTQCDEGCGCGGGLGCVENICAPCQDDSDCCAPFVCSASGQCIIEF